MRAGQRAGHAVATLLLVSACLALVALGGGLATGRLRLTPILSGSMRPTLQPGAVAVLTPIDASEVRKGDVIVFHEPIGAHALVVHRVVRVLKGGDHPIVRTKG